MSERLWKVKDVGIVSQICLILIVMLIICLGMLVMLIVCLIGLCLWLYLYTLL